jgi:hypothetical protein
MSATPHTFTCSLKCTALHSGMDQTHPGHPNPCHSLGDAASWSLTQAVPATSL